LVDPGKPFLAGIDLVDNGERVPPLPMKGYSIVQAENIDQALNLAQNHPILIGKEGRCSISVFELMTEPIEAYAQAQPAPAAPAGEQPIQPTTPPAPGTLPPPAEEAAVPTQNPGELTIPHETPEENQPPAPPSPPTPGQPSV
jgi:hypothetical protein